ncbi:MAG: protein kinase [Deltaproteobacteria bacterium]|nr:protein kinase [Deltaproteobacteria bacterium]
MSAIGLRVGPYEITAPIAIGEDGDWYAAVRADHHQPPEAMVCLLGAAPTLEQRAALQRASERYRALEDERVPAHLAYYGGSGALVLGRVRGGSLAQVMEARRRGKLSMRPATVMDIAVELAGALQHAHRKATVHGTLSPERVLLGPDGALWLLGFGAFRPLDAAWMAPEIARGARPGPETDQWSLGAITLGLVTGDPPWQGEDARTAAERGDPGLSIAPVVSQWPGLGRVLARLMSSDPSDRYPNMGAARRELLDLERKAGSGSTRRELGELLAEDPAEEELEALPTEFASDLQETEIYVEHQETELYVEAGATELFDDRSPTELAGAREVDEVRDTGEFQPSVVVAVELRVPGEVARSREGRVELSVDAAVVAKAAEEAVSRPLLKVRAGSARVAVKREALRDLCGDGEERVDRVISGQVVLDAVAVREAFGASPRSLRLTIPFESKGLFAQVAEDEGGSQDLTLPLGSSLVLATLARARGFEGVVVDAPPPSRQLVEEPVRVAPPVPVVRERPAPALPPEAPPEPMRAPQSSDTMVPLPEEQPADSAPLAPRRALTPVPEERAPEDVPQPLAPTAVAAEALEDSAPSAGEPVAALGEGPVVMVQSIPTLPPGPSPVMMPAPGPSVVPAAGPSPVVMPGPAHLEAADEEDFLGMDDDPTESGPEVGDDLPEPPSLPEEEPPAKVMQIAPIAVGLMVVVMALWLLWRFVL